MAATKKPEHIQPRVGPKQEPPTDSWWACPDAKFAEAQQKAQKRMSGGSEQVYAKANGEDES